MQTKVFLGSANHISIKVFVFAILLGISVVVPALIHVQWITGPVINAVLIISVVLIGSTEAVLLGLMPSAIALVAGLLPLSLAPMIPFIMIGNAVLVFTFHYFYKKNFFVAIGVAAFLKFVFLHFSVVWLMRGLLDGGLLSKLAVMMSWPQFFTAIIGGVVAYGFLKGVKKV